MKHKDIVEKMSLKQKADFVSGYDYWHLEEAEELGLPKIMITDGPHGLRKQNPNGKGVGLGNSYPATCMPPAATSGKELSCVPVLILKQKTTISGGI